MRILRTTGGEVLIDESAPECRACREKRLAIVPSCPIDGKVARHTTMALKGGEAFDCAKKHGFVKSQRMHKEMIANTCDLLPALAAYKALLGKKYEGDYKRLLHNIVSNNAHLIQEVYDLVSEDRLIHGGDQVSLLAKAISANHIVAAKAVLRMFQAAVAIKTEVATYERLYRETGVIHDKKHGVHRVFMNTAYKFFPDFTEQGIFLRVEPTRVEALLDYECTSIILYHLLDNARKYALPDNEINVSFLREGAVVEVKLDMVSIQIEESEVERIFGEGYTGINARRLGKAGTGYGMPVIRELTEKADIGFSIVRDVDHRVIARVDGVPYVRNYFILQLKAASQRVSGLV